MKKLLIISVLVCFAGLQLFAVNPIPSYNVLVLGRASFQEIRNVAGNNVEKEKRLMNIQTSTASPGSGISKGLSIVSITVYRLDRRVTLGPFYIYCGQSLQVSIDTSAWGVDVVTQALARVNVFTSGSAEN
jgi:hypothetical protein